MNTPEAHKEVLQTNCYSFVKPSQLYRLVGDLTGLGLLFSEGDVHKRQRRVLSCWSLRRRNMVTLLTLAYLSPFHGSLA